MIDIENFVFDTVYNHVITKHSDANITSGYDERMSSHKTMVIRQTNSVPLQSTMTDACGENHTRFTFEVEAECDYEHTARSELHDLLNDADDAMQSIKARRMYRSRPINIDRTRYRQYARYEVIAGKPYVVNKGLQTEKTIYPMYRRG